MKPARNDVRRKCVFHGKSDRVYQRKTRMPLTFPGTSSGTDMAVYINHRWIVTLRVSTLLFFQYGGQSQAKAVAKQVQSPQRSRVRVQGLFHILSPSSEPPIHLSLHLTTMGVTGLWPVSTSSSFVIGSLLTALVALIFRC